MEADFGQLGKLRELLEALCDGVRVQRCAERSSKYKVLVLIVLTQSQLVLGLSDPVFAQALGHRAGQGN